MQICNNSQSIQEKTGRPKIVRGNVYKANDLKDHYLMTELHGSSYLVSIHTGLPYATKNPPWGVYNHHDGSVTRELRIWKDVTNCVCLDTSDLG